MEDDKASGKVAEISDIFFIKKERRIYMRKGNTPKSCRVCPHMKRGKPLEDSFPDETCQLLHKQYLNDKKTLFGFHPSINVGKYVRFFTKSPHCPL